MCTAISIFTFLYQVSCALTVLCFSLNIQLHSEFMLQDFLFLSGIVMLVTLITLVLCFISCSSDSVWLLRKQQKSSVVFWFCSMSKL